MKFSEPTKATLYGLRRIAGDLLLIAPDQFALLGKKGFFSNNNAKEKRRPHAGLSVRGTLLNTIKEAVGFCDFQSIADQLKPGDPVCLSGNKIVSPAGSFHVSNEQELDGIKGAPKALDDKLLSAAPVCSFAIGKSELIRSRRAISVFLDSSPRAEVVVRLYKETQGEPRCELSLNPDRHAKPPELTNTFSWRLDHFEGEAFAFSTRDELYKQLPPSDYQVTIYTSGVAEFMAMDHRLTFIIEERKLADKAIKRRS